MILGHQAFSDKSNSRKKVDMEEISGKLEKCIALNF